jgi:hypothetical protein
VTSTTRSKRPSNSSGHSADGRRLGKWIVCNDESIEEPSVKRRKIAAVPDDYTTCDQVYMLIYQRDEAGQSDQPPDAIMKAVEGDDEVFQQEVNERYTK